VILHWLSVAAAALAAAGAIYYAACILSAIHLLAERRRGITRDADFAPPVSILKPVRGADAGALDAFRSHCTLDYPDYEIIFGVNGGVNEPEDPAVALIQQLIREFPARQIKLVAGPQVLGMNRKVSNLIQMLPQARHFYLVVNDGDIRVPPDYLRRVMAPLENERTGLVTCLYRGIAGKTLGSKLEALGVSTDFIAGVLLAGQIERGLRFGLGSTLAFSRRALEASGGFGPLADYLADDYELGRRIHQAGFEVALADVNVQTLLPGYSLGDFWQHQLRWARTVRDSRRWGYVGLLFTFGWPWALMAVAFSMGALWSWILLAAALVARFAMALTIGSGVLKDPQVLSNLLLVPLRDVAAVLVWVASFAGHTIVWGGTQFVLKDGRLHPIG
jgi:ceramide glucosyltransferase